MDTFLQDLRYAVRTLIKNPGFAVLTITCLALGIGVNSTIFSVVDTIAIRALPFRDSEQLVSLETRTRPMASITETRRSSTSGLEGAHPRVRGHRDVHRAQPDPLGRR